MSRFAFFGLAGYLSVLLATPVAAQSLDLNIPAGAICPAAMLQPDMQMIGRAQVSKLKTFWATSPLNPDHGEDLAVLPSLVPGQLFGDMIQAIRTTHSTWNNTSPLEKILSSIDFNIKNDKPNNHKLLYVCFPELKEVFFSAQQRIRAAQEDEARQQQEDAEEIAKPENVLFRSYAKYIYLKRCYDDREGYLSVNISDPELEKARTAVSSIEQKLLQANPGLDKDTIWKRANSANSVENHLDRDDCQGALNALEKTYEALVPGAKDVKKDF